MALNRSLEVKAVIVQIPVGHFVHRSGTVLAILVVGHLNNIPMKFE